MLYFSKNEKKTTEQNNREQKKEVFYLNRNFWNLNDKIRAKTLRNKIQFSSNSSYVF